MWLQVSNYLPWLSAAGGGGASGGASGWAVGPSSVVALSLLPSSSPSGAGATLLLPLSAFSPNSLARWTHTHTHTHTHTRERYI